MERFCSDCKLAQRATIKSAKRVSVVVNEAGVADIPTLEVSQSFTPILRRGCGGGGGTETVKGFDKCISKNEFIPLLLGTTKGLDT